VPWASMYSKADDRILCQHWADVGVCFSFTIQPDYYFFILRADVPSRNGSFARSFFPVHYFECHLCDHFLVLFLFCSYYYFCRSEAAKEVTVWASRFSQKLLTNFDKILLRGWAWPGRKCLDFGGDPDSCESVWIIGQYSLPLGDTVVSSPLYSSGGSTRLGGGLRSAIASTCYFVIVILFLNF